MKPIHVLALEVEHEDVSESVIELVKDMEPGYIDSVTLADEAFCMPKLLHHLQINGYKKRECEWYAPLSYTYCNGSAGWHTDPGFGMVAAWAVYISDGSCPELITRHGATPMRRGDIVVFNSNCGHAWISNTQCVLAMATVKKSINN